MEGKREESIRKGPWKEEEDEVVINHVKKYGPRDWSSIRSKGLLQRTGKSCRLRWVNKLRPNLKNGCKFSAEEERVVIELQAQFGNKWAKIATYLHGRTDNDVKNFWSSRQKRLARILHNSAATSSKSHKNFNREVSGFTNVPSSEDQIHQKYCCSSMEEKSISEVQSCSLSNFDNYEMIEMVPLPDQVNPKLVRFDTNHAHPEDLSQPKISNYCTESQLQVPQPQQDMTLSEGNQPLLARFEDLFDMFGPMNGSLDDAPELAAVEQLFLKPGTSCGDGCQNPVNPDVFFDDFPTDMFDQIEPLPSPSDW